MRNIAIGNGFRWVSLRTCLTVVLGLLLLPGLALGQTFVQQVNNTPSGVDNVVFTSPETAGDLNVVIVGLSEAASVTSVTDSNNNTYVLAGASSGNGVGIAVYYARNISVSTTTMPTVAVTLTSAQTTTPDIRVLEYTGFSSSAVTVDNWVGNSNTNSPASSGTLTTSTSSLIVGAGTASNQFTSGGIPSGLTTRGVNGFGDVAMDSNGAVGAGNYSAGANVLDAWVMEAVGFSISGIGGPAPTVASILPTSGPVAGGTAVAITGTNFLNGAYALFGTAPGGLSAVNCVVVSSTTLNCNTPPDSAVTADVTVANIDGKTGFLSGAYDYVVINPSISGVSPSASTTNGTVSVTISGSNFESGATVQVGGPLPHGGTGIFGDHVVVNSSSSITFTTPAWPVGSAQVDVSNPDGGEASDPGALTYTLGTGAINYIQRGDAATGSSAQNIPVPMTNPQGAGNLNVVIIGWSDTTSLVVSVTDTEGNVYVPASATISGTALSQVIYYAKNIIGDGITPNQINVSFNQSASSPDVRVLEYSGLSPVSPLDQAASNAGNGSLADAGPCTTTSAVELIVAGTTVSSAVTGAGLNFATVDYTVNGDNAEQQITSAAGSCEAQTVMLGGNWVTQAVSFKAGSGLPASFTVTAAPPTTQTVAAGSSASYALTLAAQNGFAGSVTLACSGLPTGASCLFSPNPVTPGSSTADTLTISTLASTPAGTSTVTVTGTSGALTSSATVTLTVTATTTPNFTIAAAPPTATIATPGGSAISSITITPAAGFSATVGLTCAVTGGGTPAPTCGLSPTSISPGTSSALTVNTTPNTAAKLAPPTGVFLLLPIGGMALLGAGLTSRRRKLLGIMLLCMVIASFIFMVACGGSSGSTTPPPSGGTPAGTYTVTVTGTSAGLSAQTTTFTVTVQ